MRLVSMNFAGNLHTTTGVINKLAIGQWVLCMECVHGSSSVVVFRFPDYPSYVNFCEKVGEKPLSTKAYFGNSERSFAERG